MEATKSRSKPEGLRERKRKETLRRIAEAALNLFLANGYNETTLDEIADAAGISRRTFFYYFKSKEEVLLAWQNHMAEEIRAAVLAEPKQASPLDTVRDALLKLMTRYDSVQPIAINKLARSSEKLRASRQAKFALQEKVLFEVLCELWPQPKRRNALRTVAMMSIGALRLAMDTWVEDGGKQPAAKYLKEAFARLKDAL